MKLIIIMLSDLLGGSEPGCCHVDRSAWWCLTWLLSCCQILVLKNIIDMLSDLLGGSEPDYCHIFRSTVCSEPDYFHVVRSTWWFWT